jgi:hypothetical protein
VIPDDHQLMLWRLNPVSFSMPSDINRVDGYLGSIVYTILCAVCSDGAIGPERFIFARAESGVITPPQKPYAVNLQTRRVFDLSGGYLRYWSTPEQALKTMLTEETWWRPWTQNDEAIAKAARDEATWSRE